MAYKKTTIIVSDTTLLERIDKFLAKELSEITREYIQKLVKDQAIVVNNKKTKASYVLRPGDIIDVSIPEAKKMELEAKNIPLDIIYEDKNIIVLNKAPGVVVHPAGSKYRENSLVNALLFHCEKSLSGISGVLRPGIVHRLDKDTSGLLVVAKNDAAHKYLMQQFKARTIQKIYIALVLGKLESKKGIINAPIGRHHKDRKKMGITYKEGREAVTKYEVIDDFKECSLVKIKLLTGRTHQIRVHFSSIGHPLVGDTLYGNIKANDAFAKKYGLQRIFLHSLELGLSIPGERNKKIKLFSTDLPKDLKVPLEKLQKI